MNLNKKTTTAGETVSISYRHGEADFSDLVHVVRCKDCKFHTDDDECVNPHWDCEESVTHPTAYEYDYCSYGQRRKE